MLRFLRKSAFYLGYAPIFAASRMARLLGLTTTLRRIPFMRAVKRGVESSLLKALPDTSTVLVEAQGFPLMVHTDNSYMSQSLIMAGIHEREETEFFRSIAATTNTFIDVGANIGYFTGLMSRLMPNGAVLAIKPDPVNLETLRRNVSLNRLQNTTIIPFALSNRPHSVTLFRDQTNCRHSANMGQKVNGDSVLN
jgi:hypothetical protein